jgi:uncharacterized protein YjbJ (UPF0337 family)
MTVTAKMKGQIKESAGKLTGDKGMEAEGKFEKGVAEVKRIVGGVVDNIAGIVGRGVNTVTSAIADVYRSARKTMGKLF